MARTFDKLVALVAGVFFALFFFWPVGETIWGAFRSANGDFTLAFIAEVFRNPLYLEGLWNALQMGIWSTLLAGLIAIPLAWLSDRYQFPGKSLLGGLILFPLILPPFVGALGIKQLLGQQGALNALLSDLGWMNPNLPIDWLGQGRLWGVVLMNALHLYPVLFLNVTAALANVDPALHEAAENLGCTGFRKFRRITLPLIMPGIFAGGTLVFIWAFTELGVPLMFDFTRVTSVQIFDGLKDLEANPFPFALALVLLGSSTLLYLAGKFFWGRETHPMAGKATSQGGPRPAGPWGSALCVGAFLAIGALAALPHLGVILIAFSTDWYQTLLPSGFTLAHFKSALAHNLTLPSIQNSLKYASFSTSLDLILGAALAYTITRSKLRGRYLLDAMAMLPMAVPGLMLAFGYLAMTQEGKIFAILNPRVDPLVILVIAYAVRRLPYAVRSAVAGFQQSSVILEEAAQSLGCPPLRSLWRITLPLILPNLLAGALLAFSFAMLEVSDSLILAQKQQDFPITKSIYELNQLLGEGRFVACALGVWAMAFLGLTLLGASIVLGKKLGAMFRA